jgi:hypothetical protein
MVQPTFPYYSHNHVHAATSTQSVDPTLTMRKRSTTFTRNAGNTEASCMADL